MASSPPSRFVFYRDLVIPESEWSSNKLNRAFRYGDALFETVRISQGKPLFLMHHYSRFILGMETLRMEIPEFWQPEFFRKGIRDLAKVAEIPNGRLRITTWRDGSGKYEPQTNSVELLMEIEPLDQPFYSWSKGGVSVDISLQSEVGLRAIDRVKSANALPYVLASMEARDRGMDDLILLNTAGRVAEATSSNVFLFSDGRLITPDETECGVPGVIRRVLIKIARREGIEVEQRQVLSAELQEADEIFLTNAIHGIRWVSQFGNRIHGSDFSFGLFGKLEEQVLRDLSGKR